jgi:cytochrome c oxidase cbb3-type subunit 3
MRAIGSQLVMPSLLALVFCLTVAGCKREKRQFRMAAPMAETSDIVSYNDTVRAGPQSGETPSTSQPVQLNQVLESPASYVYPQNAQALSDGQMLYESFNCSGCHAHGGGGIGPPLLDKKWFYGSQPQQVYISILEGRPNGMPSFRGRIPDFQIWELVAYVRSLSGQASPNAASGREEHMNTTLPPNSTPKEKPEKVPEPTTGPTTTHIAMPTTTGAKTHGTDPTTAATSRPGKVKP